MDFFTQFPVLAGMIQEPPGAIIGPIAFVFGHIVDFFFRGVSFITPVNALGISIILLTLIVRGALVPSQFNMQRNSRKMAKMKPEMDKIREKYGNTKDPEMRRKMVAEQQALQQKHGVNMLSSCVPLLVTMPIFIALFAVFGRAFLFIPSITDVYSSLSQALIDTPFHTNVLAGIVEQYRPAGMSFNTHDIYDLNRALHVMTNYDWNVIFGVLEGQTVSEIFNNYGYVLRYHAGDGIFSPLTQEMLEATVANVPAGQLDTLRYYYEAKLRVQSFLGLDMVTPSGWALPGIVIPILAVLTMAYSSWQMQKINPPQDDQAKMMQRIMIFVMPLAFGWFTVGAASAVGVYWVAGNVFMIGQNFIIHKFFAHKLDEPTKPRGWKNADKR